jgi:N-acetylated-alpha-linked acidic dipeptidase
MKLDFTSALNAARRFEAAGAQVRAVQLAPPANVAGLNEALRNAETALLSQAGLPHRAWYKHLIYAPGEYTGYAAVVIPGVNEAISAPDTSRAQTQLGVLADALNRSAAILEAAK